MENVKANQIIQIIYTSTAVTPFSKDQLKTLLTKARKHNHSLHISGMLVYDDGFFIQVLEGPEQAVNELFSYIEKDPRHNSVCLLLRHHVREKEFEDWSMGFVDTASLPRQEGFIPYRTLRETIQDKTRARKLIKMFQEGRWRQVVNR